MTLAHSYRGSRQGGHGSRRRRPAGHILSTFGKHRMTRRWGLAIQQQALIQDLNAPLAPVKPHPSEVSRASPTKQHHHLGAKYSNICAYGGCFTLKSQHHRRHQKTPKENHALTHLSRKSINNTAITVNEIDAET